MISPTSTARSAQSYAVSLARNCALRVPQNGVIKPPHTSCLSNVKTSGGYNIGIGEVLEILTDSATFNPLTYKPVITRITSFGGHNELMTKKRGVTSMNVYWRRKGEETWRLLAAKRVKFPVQDDNAPATPGQAEVREYRVIGVLGDQEVGQPSDIAEATWRP